MADYHRGKRSHTLWYREYPFEGKLIGRKVYFSPHLFTNQSAFELSAATYSNRIVIYLVAQLLD